MYISNIVFDDCSWHAYNATTIELINVRPDQRERLLALVRTGREIDIFAYGPYFTHNKVTTDIKVTKVIYHNPATIVFWSDGTKTVVKCDKNDTYDPEKGFYIACAKKLFGNNYAAVGRINKALEMAEDKNEKRDSKENS